MRAFYIQTDTNTFITDLGFQTPANRIDFKNNDTANVAVYLCSGSTALSSTLSATYVRYGAKQSLSDSTFVIQASAVGNIAQQYLTLSPKITATNLINLLSATGSTTLLSEFSYSQDSGSTWNHSQTFSTVVTQNII